MPVGDFVGWDRSGSGEELSFLRFDVWADILGIGRSVGGEFEIRVAGVDRELIANFFGGR